MCSASLASLTPIQPRRSAALHQSHNPGPTEPTASSNGSSFCSARPTTKRMRTPSCCSIAASAAPVGTQVRRSTSRRPRAPSPCRRVVGSEGLKGDLDSSTFRSSFFLHILYMPCGGLVGGGRAPRQLKQGLATPGSRLQCLPHRAGEVWPFAAGLPAQPSCSPC